VRRLPPICPACHETLKDWPLPAKAPENWACGNCGHLLNKAELERQADELAAALFEELDE
jgi:hypothetical protein